jgi:glutamate racemase
MSDPRPVGVFDSGVGGVTLLGPIRAQLPAESCIYLADSLEAPYGIREPAYIRARCQRIVDFLLEQGVKAVVVACNTASVVALSPLRARYSVPFVGIVPAVKPAARLTQTGKIGVLATPTTTSSEPLARLIEEFAGGVRVITRMCPELVPLIEEGVVDGAELEGLLNAAVGPMLEAGVDVVVLGCTHFPLARAAIQRACGPNVTLIDPANAVARQLARVLQERGLAHEGEGAETIYYTTGDLERFACALTRLVGPLAGIALHVDL